eukprot:2958446-Amphidinium_carterae.1
MIAEQLVAEAFQIASLTAELCGFIRVKLQQSLERTFADIGGLVDVLHHWRKADLAISAFPASLKAMTHAS